MTDNDVTLLMSRMERNIAPDDKDYFKYAIHVMPRWILTVPGTVKYLVNIDAPVAKWKMHYTIANPTATNHALTECPYPKLGAIYTGETGLLI